MGGGSTAGGGKAFGVGLGMVTVTIFVFSRGVFFRISRTDSKSVVLAWGEVAQ